MNFDKDKAYKLQEMEGALVITDRDTKVKGAEPLILADASALLAYMDRYFYERERGTPRSEAHNLAMHTAGVTEIRRPG